jgi:protocatechuate 3,4-dioxygenase beta subunit
MTLERREFLERAAQAGALLFAAPLSLVSVSQALAAAARKPTPADALGPFYRRLAPHQAVLRAPGDPGLPLKLAGIVYSDSGATLPRASVELWQTNASGQYDTVGNRYRTALLADAKGGYGVESVIPGHYPGRVCQHVHYLVRAEGHKPLVTQLYFATDRVFDGDPDRNYTRDPLCTSRELVRPVVLTGEPKAIVASVSFDLVLERA